LGTDDLARAYYYRGMASDYDHAIADFNEAIKIKPDDGRVYYWRGESYAAKDDPAKAITDFRNAARLIPEGGQFRAEALQKAAELEKKIAETAPPAPAPAAADLSNAVDGSREDSPDKDWTVCVKDNQPDASIRACANIITAGRESRENLALAYASRGAAYGNKGDYEREMADLTKATEIDPQLASAYVNRGAAFGSKGDYNRAIADESKAIRLNPSLAMAYFNRGAAYGNKGEYDLEIADETESIRLNPQYGLAYNNRALAYWHTGDFAKSLADYHAAAQLIPATDPWHDRALAQIGKLEAGLVSSPAPPAEAVAAAPFGRRVGLVIANSAYGSVPQLANPRNDAKLISDALRADGFIVTQADDLDRDGLVRALRTFGNDADAADWAVVYFAGHGMEVGGTNYLIPVDAKLLSDRDIDFEAVSLKQVMHEIEGAHSLRVVILDACRSNPFETTMKRTNGGERDVGRGLARIEPARGTVVFYSAKEGTIAADGAGSDSPFATALARHLTDGGVEVDKMFRRVIDDVLDATGNKQEPFVYGSLTAKQDFYFRPQ
jgi:tetratricopeptide (TPR) repeat protein